MKAAEVTPWVAVCKGPGMNSIVRARTHVQACSQCPRERSVEAVKGCEWLLLPGPAASAGLVFAACTSRDKENSLLLAILQEHL